MHTQIKKPPVHQRQIHESKRPINSQRKHVDKRPEAQRMAALQRLAATRARPQDQKIAQLQALADTHTPAQRFPIQRQPTDLKAQMGAQHGVDLSGVKEISNSSFPASVGAIATIQGKRVDYAPSQFTTANRKHELGHAIDNAKNGTPKGDTLVNGQKVDTTRERAAQKIADTPLQNKAEKVSLQRNESESNAFANTEPLHEGESNDRGLKQYDTTKVSGTIADTLLQRNLKEIPKRKVLKRHETTEMNEILAEPLGKKSSELDDNQKKDAKDFDDARMEDTEVQLIRMLEKAKALQYADSWKDHSWDFKHWMTVGEMPNTFGYGLYCIDYYKLLSKEDQKNFDGQTTKMKSSTTIVRILERFQPQTNELEKIINGRVNPKEMVKEFIALKQEHLINIQEKNKIADEAVQIWNEDYVLDWWTGEEILEPTGKLEKLVKEVKELASEASGKSTEDKKEYIKSLNTKYAEYASYGHSLWKHTASLDIENKETQAMVEQFTKRLKHQLKMFDGDPYFLMDFNKGDMDVKVLLRRTIGEIGRAWGDATAALGLHPFSYKPIETTISTTVHAYEGDNFEQGDKKQTSTAGKPKLDQYIEELTKEGKVVWTDMDAPGPMWSKAANFDRYRNTQVELYLSAERGLNDVQKSDFMVKVTFSELQLSVLPALALEGDFANTRRVFRKVNTKDLGDEKNFASQVKPKSIEHFKSLIQSGYRIYINKAIVL